MENTTMEEELNEHKLRMVELERQISDLKQQIIDLECELGIRGKELEKYRILYHGIAMLLQNFIEYRY